MTEPNCADCAHWDSRDTLVGFCQEITDCLVLEQSLLVHGLATCRTTATGRCRRFEPSAQAMKQAEAEEKHLRELRAEAGRDYPLSLA